MPVRSLNSAVLKWPDREAVLAAARAWAAELRRRHAEVVRVGCVGSYARGDWGVGSDLDLVILVRQCPEPPEVRYGRYDLSSLPVPADLWVYTEAEWASLPVRWPGLGARIRQEWLDL